MAAWLTIDGPAHALVCSTHIYATVQHSVICTPISLDVSVTVSPHNIRSLGAALPVSRCRLFLSHCLNRYCKNHPSYTQRVILVDAAGREHVFGCDK